MMDNNLLLELRPKYNFMSRLIFYVVNSAKFNQGMWVIFAIALYALIIFSVVLANFYGKDIDISFLFCVFFIIACFLLCILYPFFLGYRERKKFENYVFKIYEDKIEFVGAPSYLKRTMLNFSDIDEIIFSQNSFQKRNGLISVEFISSKEHYTIVNYDHAHKNIIFFDVPNTQALHDILNRKFDED